MGSEKKPLRARLTPREEAVLSHLVTGASNPDIAAKLRCSVRTVEFHVSNILRKAGETSRIGLIVKALRDK